MTIGERAEGANCPPSKIPVFGPARDKEVVRREKEKIDSSIFLSTFKILIAEEDPSMSWLFLVTAIEKTALRWKAAGINKKDILREFKTILYKKLKTFERNEEILLIVADNVCWRGVLQIKRFSFRLKG